MMHDQSTEASGQARNRDDVALVTRVASGELDAIGVLYDRYAAQVFGLAYRVLRNAGDAEDTVQDVFVQAWRRATQYDASRGTVAAWLLVMARTRAIDRLRAARVVTDADSPEILQQLVATAPPATEVLIASDRTTRVRRAMTTLPVEQRETLELAYFEGLTQSEIAGRLSQPLGTIKTRIRLALAALRRCVQ